VAKTPFYGTMGGQTGDSGVIKTENGTFIVQDTIHVAGSKIAHIGYCESGVIAVGEVAELAVDAKRRGLICNNHSATHLLQKALKTVLGDHVEQAGSLVEDGRLRFDFTHNQGMSAEEIAKVEEIVNKEIAEDLSVVTRVMGIEDAKKTGAMALFGEKYGEEVRVVSMGDFSIELCGGTHVPHTGVIGTFKILSEQGISAGVRRIEALTGEGAFAYYKELEKKLNAAAAAAKTEPDRLVARIEGLLEEVKKLTQENQKLKAEAAKSAASDVMGNVVKEADLSILPVSLTDVDMNELRNLGDEFKAKLGKSVVILASAAGDKVNLLVMASDDAVASGIHAGNIVKKIAPMVGGGGGGRPNMAQAGGKNAAGIKDALAAGVEEAKGQLK
jgi:alanyl-tRNA synthetase